MHRFGEPFIGFDVAGNCFPGQLDVKQLLDRYIHSHFIRVHWLKILFIYFAGIAKTARIAARPSGQIHRS